MFICKLAVVLIFALLIVVTLEKMQKTTVIGGQPPPPRPSARPDVPWGPRYIILEVLAPPLRFSTFLGFSPKSGGHIWPRRGKDPTKGHFGRCIRRRDPYTTSRFEENPKNVENPKGGANTSRMMYRGPQGTPGRPGGERPRIKPVPVLWGA